MNCNICPNNCGIDRSAGKTGRCGVSDEIRIAKYYLHPYEEPLISGTRGSGTVFFCGCSLRCRFCQNYELSRAERGKTITPKELAEIFKTLEDEGAHNINLVTPTHYALKIAEALDIYKPAVPVVYNTHGYESLKTLEIIDPYVNVYLPDLKFFSPSVSERYTGIKDYFSVASEAIKFMMDKKTAEISDGLMKNGVIVRHLILPMNSKDSVSIAEWFIKNRKNGAKFSLMSQYTPFGDIENYPELKRKITRREYERALDALYGLSEDEYFTQSLSSSSEKYIPDWTF